MVVKPSDFFMFMLAFCTWILLMFLQFSLKTFPTEIETRKCPQQNTEKQAGKAKEAGRRERHMQKSRELLTQTKILLVLPFT